MNPEPGAGSEAGAWARSFSSSTALIFTLAFTIFPIHANRFRKILRAELHGSTLKRLAFFQHVILCYSCNILRTGFKTILYFHDSYRSDAAVRSEFNKGIACLAQNVAEDGFDRLVHFASDLKTELLGTFELENLSSLTCIIVFRRLILFDLLDLGMDLGFLHLASTQPRKTST